MTESQNNAESWVCEIESHVGEQLSEHGYIRVHYGQTSDGVREYIYAFYKCWDHWLLFVKSGQEVDVFAALLPNIYGWIHLRILLKTLDRMRQLPDPMTWSDISRILRGDFDRLDKFLLGIWGSLLLPRKLRRLARKHRLTVPNSIKLFEYPKDPKKKKPHELILACFPYLLDEFGYGIFRIRESKSGFTYWQVHATNDNVYLCFEYSLKDHMHAISFAFSNDTCGETHTYVDSLIRLIDDNVNVFEIPSFMEWGRILRPFVVEIHNMLSPGRREETMKLMEKEDLLPRMPESLRKWYQNE